MRGIAYTQGLSHSKKASSEALSLRGFRDELESVGFYFHVAIDMSMEGYRVAYADSAEQDLHHVHVLPHLQHEVHPHHVLFEREHERGLLCGRFLASKVPSVGSQLLRINAPFKLTANGLCEPFVRFHRVSRLQCVY